MDSNRSVSRRHAKILRKNEKYYVLEEVGTVSGTYVNDQKIPSGEPVEINNGDRLRIGLDPDEGGFRLIWSAAALPPHSLDCKRKRRHGRRTPQVAD